MPAHAVWATMRGMCLIALAWQAHPRYALAMIANRDEAHARPTAPAGPDPDDPSVYGGRDLLQGGSWLMASTHGRLAAVTNVRDGRSGETSPRSRGGLVREFVRDAVGADDYLASLASTAKDYGRFNLVVWDGRSLAFASNYPEFAAYPVSRGVHAMSNGAFDATWPKSGRATRALSAWLDSPASMHGDDNDPERLEPLFQALADTTPAPDDQLPDTRVGLELERKLSPPFVSSDVYGTRCSTIVLVSADGIAFTERRFGPNAVPQGQSTARLPRTAVA